MRDHACAQGPLSAAARCGARTVVAAGRPERLIPLSASAASGDRPERETRQVIYHSRASRKAMRGGARDSAQPSCITAACTSTPGPPRARGRGARRVHLVAQRVERPHGRGPPLRQLAVDESLHAREVRRRVREVARLQLRVVQVARGRLVSGVQREHLPAPPRARGGQRRHVSQRHVSRQRHVRQPAACAAERTLL
jgi:hypothetical protein